MPRPTTLALSVVAVLLAASPAASKPPEPTTFKIPPAEEGKEYHLEIHPEYRTRFIHIDPLELNGTTARKVSWAEQRLRVDMTVARPGLAAVYLQADILDGVLFGDNGEFFQDPAPTSGVNIASKQANNAGWQVALLPNGDRLSANGYGPVLRSIEPIRINYAYGEVLLPFGLLRVGRQPITSIGTVSLHDGRAGRNRWGSEFYHQSVDRIAFGTKISEIVGLLTEDDYEVDASLDRGVFWAFVYDWLVEDDVYVGADDLNGVATQFRFMYPRIKIGDLTLSDFTFWTTFTYRWDERFSTDIFALPLFLSFGVDDWFKFRWEFSYVFGATRELSAGFAELSSADVVLQDLRTLATRLTLDFTIGPVTLVADFGYSSGDADPRSTTPQTTGNWPRDHNFGLLLFEHIIGFQSARSAAVGIENLKDDPDAETFPLTEVQTDGRVTNMVGFFPQVFVDPWDFLRFKAGVLFAWSDTDTVDPIQTSLAFDGDEISDDAVNFFGGKPGNYWGTEFDLGIEFYYKDVLWVTIEGAYLIPGNALHDENGDAVNSFMVESRIIFRL